MIDRKTIYYYIGLATLCVTVVVVLVFYVKPLVAGKSIKISKAPSGQKGGVFKALDYTASTLAIMQSKNEDKEIILSMNTDRNPFLWYDEIGPKKENFEHRKKKIRQGPLPKLGMIIVSPKRRIVYLDHKPVYEAQLDALKGNIIPAALGAMRDASKTGGALGQVSDREGNWLAASLGALNMEQSPEQVVKQLKQIDEALTRWQVAVDEHNEANSLPEDTEEYSDLNWENIN